MKKLAILVLALVMCLTAVSAMAAEYSVDSFADLKAAFTAIEGSSEPQHTINVTDSFEIDVSKNNLEKFNNDYILYLVANDKNVVINMNKNTITFDGNNTTTLTAMALNGGTFTISNGSFYTENYGTKKSNVVSINNGGSLTVDKMSITGSSFSGQGVLYLGATGKNTLNVYNTTMDLKNVVNAALINSTSNSSSVASTINVTNSTIKADNGCIGIVVHNKRTLNMKNSTVTLKNMKGNGINILGEANFDNTDVTVDGSAERGITLRDGNSKLSLSNGSVFNLSNCEQGDIMFKHPTIRDNIIKVDASSNIYFDTVTQEVNKKPVEIEPKDYIGAYDLPNNKVVTQLPDGTYYIGAPAPADVVVEWDAPATGDTENLMMWVALMAMAAMGLVATRKMSRQ